MAVDVDDRIFGARLQVLGGDKRRLRLVLSDRGRREFGISALSRARSKLAGRGARPLRGGIGKRHGERRGKQEDDGFFHMKTIAAGL